MREFLTSNGLRWTVAQLESPQFGSILRFTSSDGGTFDLPDGPPDWVDSSDDILTGLLRHAILVASAQSAERTAATY